MSARNEMATNPGEQACQLCHQAQLDPDLYGRKRQEQGLCVHRYCLFFASGLYPVPTGSGRVGYFSSHVQGVIERAAQKICCVCGESGACINCWVLGCGRSFHLPCALQGECITQYFDYYRAFCSRHRPQQAVDRDPEPHTDCLLCFEAVDGSKSYTTMGCPACQHAWFHRRCIQGHALRAGISAFQCLLCRDKERFQREMLRMGIRIPRRPPAWETIEAFEGLMARHSRCDASECLCPAGSEQAEEEGPWQLLLCSSCAAEGTHRSCSSLRDGADSWECQGCAGPSTASRVSCETAAPSSASRAGPGPRQGSAAPEGSSRSAAPGPMWVRAASRLQRRAQHQPYSRPRRRRQGSPTSAPTAGSSPPSQAAPALPRSSLPAPAGSPRTASRLPAAAASSSPAADSRSPAGPVRGTHRLRRRTTNPYSRPGQRPGT